MAVGNFHLSGERLEQRTATSAHSTRLENARRMSAIKSLYLQAFVNYEQNTEAKYFLEYLFFEIFTNSEIDLSIFNFTVERLTQSGTTSAQSTRLENARPMSSIKTL